MSQANFKVRGEVIDATNAVFEGGNAASLTNGAFIEAKLTLQNGVLVANKIVFKAAPSGTFDKGFQFVGVISDYDAVARTFKIAGNTVKVVSDELNALLTTLGFANGKTFSVMVKLNGTSLELLKIAVPREAPAPAVVLKGIASEVTSTAFKINGLTVNIANDTEFEDGTATNLVNGVQIAVKLKPTETGQALVAAKIEFESNQSSGPSVRVESLITDFISSADMKVGGVKVNAANAIFVQGTAADLANGKRVRVDGAVDTSGVLIATKVEFR